MLESMINSDTPTRAEVNDVAIALYDGVDAIMLSAETAIGSYPVEAVEMMSNISTNIEADLDTSNFNRNIIDSLSTSITNNYLAICHAAYSIASDLDLKIIVVLTDSGKTAIQMAQFRPNATIVAFTPHQETCNLLSIIWGVVPIYTKQPQNINGLYSLVNKILIKKNLIQPENFFLITSGILKIKNSTNMLQIYQSK
jgi:pyruvate kinase